MATSFRARFPFVLGGILLVTFPNSAPSSNIDPHWQTRFDTERPQAWDQYRQAKRYLQGVCREEAQATGVPASRTESEVKINETCRLVRFTDLIAGTSEVFGQNPKYWFRLKSGKEGAWVLVALYHGSQQKTDQAQDFERRMKMYDRAAVGRVFRLGIDPTGKQFEEVVRVPQGRVTALTPKQQAGTELVEVRFEVTPDNEAPMTLLGGTLLLDPERDWLPIVKTTMTRNKVGTGTQTTEYEFQSGAHPHPRRAVERQEYNLFNTAEPWRGTWTTEYDLRVPERLPATTEFTLSAFGLPEPIGVTWERETPRYVWFLLGAVAFGVLAFGLRFLARRRVAVSGTKP
jgi:hypothetical protein